MKKFILFCLLGIMSPFGWAQGLIPAVSKSINAGKKAVSAVNMSARLQQRVQETFAAAKRVEQQAKEVQLCTYPSKEYLEHIVPQGRKPVNSGQIFTYFEPEELYPYAPAGLTRAQMPKYILAKHNLEVRKWWLRYQQIQREILARLPEFEAALVPVSHRAAQDAVWLADQIGPQHKYLLLGEVHGIAEIPRKLTQLVQEIARQNSASAQPREIFLFTEFLPESLVWNGNEMFSRFFEDVPVWDALQKIGVPVIGLEPEFVEDASAVDLHFDIPDEWKDTVETNFWTSIEGIRLRNARWLQIIKRYRAEHPEALFIIYAGLGHVSYIKPYSLGEALAGPETLVTLMYPNKIWASTEFHYWAGRKFFHRVTQFNRPDLARLAGFDIGIRIPVGAESFQ